jgi:hypothetical protein
VKLRRRDFLGVSLAGLVQVPAAVCAFPGMAPGNGGRLHVFDSRRGEPDTPALRQAELLVDVATTGELDWIRLLRSGLSRIDVVTGETGWQDFVVLRDLFREAGLWQTRPERRLDSPSAPSRFDWHLSR